VSSGAYRITIFEWRKSGDTNGVGKIWQKFWMDENGKWEVGSWKLEVEVGGGGEESE
jgi:hypothetical protein